MTYPQYIYEQQYSLFQSRQLFLCSQLHVTVITGITINSQFHLNEIKLHQIAILVNQNDILEHMIKVAITVA